MAQIYIRKRFSSYLGEERAIDDIVRSFIPDGPTPTPPTPTPSVTPTTTPIVPTPSVTPTNTPSVTPTTTPTLTPTPTEIACDFTFSILPTPTPTPTNTSTPTTTPTETPTPTPTLTPTSSPVSAFDPDAAAYLADVLNEGGTLDPTISAATDTLFTSLKSNGLYSKMKAFYPVLGGVEASHAINGNGNTSFNLTFVNSFTHSYSGFVGTTASSYANTNYNPSVEHTGGTMSIGYFTNTSGTSFGDSYMIGSYAAGNRFLAIDYESSGVVSNWFNGKYLDNTVTSRIFVGDRENLIGFVQLGADGTTKTITHNLNGVDSLASGAQDGTTLPNFNIYLSALNLLDSPYKGQGSRLAFAYMGDYLTSGETTTLSTIINTFQTSLGRNTY